MAIGYIKGIGRTKFGILNESLKKMMKDAIANSLTDSHLITNEICVVIVSNFISGIIQNQLHLKQQADKNVHLLR